MADYRITVFGPSSPSYIIGVGRSHRSGEQRQQSMCYFCRARARGALSRSATTRSRTPWGGGCPPEWGSYSDVLGKRLRESPLTFDLQLWQALHSREGDGRKRMVGVFEHVGGESSRVLQMPLLPIRDNRCLITGQTADILDNLERIQAWQTNRMATN